MESKLYHQIGQVCVDTGLSHSTLRFWEKAFPYLRPSRSSGGHRYYSNEQVKLLLYLKQLLYEEGYTLEGAKKRLSLEKQQMKTEKKQPIPPDENGSTAADDSEKLKQYLKNELKAILSILEK